jgi:hypothetical protein
MRMSKALLDVTGYSSSQENNLDQLRAGVANVASAYTSRSTSNSLGYRGRSRQTMPSNGMACIILSKIYISKCVFFIWKSFENIFAVKI